MTKCRLAFIFALGLLVAPAKAGQITPDAPRTPAAPADAAPPDAAKAAFLAAPERNRKALQEALGWLGFYNGTVDGAFGKRTIEALRAYQRSVGAPADGIASEKQLAALEEGARKAKAAVGFVLLDDPASGVRIGAPLKLLDRREQTPGAAHLSNQDGSITLDLVQQPGALADLYKRALAEAPGRKITYKASKPDAFFVVVGEQSGRKFYRRVAEAPGGADPIARGFTFAYPIDRAKAFEPLSLAIANAFDPFPTAPPPAAIKPAPPPPPPPPKLAATALVIGKGRAVTFLDPADCPEPLIGGKPARFAPGAAEGLAQLEGDFAGAAPSLAASAGGDLIVLSFAPAGAGRAVLQVADAQALASGQVLAALDASARGAPVLDRRGGFAGLVSPLKDPPSRRAGVALSAPHVFAAPATLGTALAIGPARPGEALGAAGVAKRMRNSLVAVFCAA